MPTSVISLHFPGGGGILPLTGVSRMPTSVISLHDRFDGKRPPELPATSMPGSPLDGGRPRFELLRVTWPGNSAQENYCLKKSFAFFRQSGH